jgi:CBS domain-containing protein
MKINDIMTHRASYVGADASVAEAARVMRMDDVTYLPVLEHGRVAGSITEQDIVTRCLAEGSNPENIAVRVIMCDDPSTVFIDADACAVARLMEKKRLRRLPVLDREGDLAGVVSLGDVARGQFRVSSKGRHELSDALPHAV